MGEGKEGQEDRGRISEGGVAHFFSLLPALVLARRSRPGWQECNTLMLRRVARVAILIVFTFASSGCLLSRRGGEQPAERQSLGTFALSSDSLGHVSLAPASCSAGDRQFFLGAD